MTAFEFGFDEDFISKEELRRTSDTLIECACGEMFLESARDLHICRPLDPLPQPDRSIKTTLGWPLKAYRRRR